MPQRHLLAENIKEQVLADLNRDFHQSDGEHTYQTDQNLAASIKADVLAELEKDSFPRSTAGMRLTRSEREAIKQDVLREMGQNMWDDSPYRRSALDQAVVENVKNELLAEMQMARQGGNPTPSWQNIISDRNIDRRIDRQYGDLKNLRGQIRRGLETVQETDRRLNASIDPRALDAVNAIIHEARQEGVPLDQVITWLKTGDRTGTGFGQRAGDFFTSNSGKGFLWGVGISLIAASLFPATRQGLRSLGVKMMEGTLSAADQTRSTFGRVSEDFEDMIAEANYHNLQEGQSIPMDQENLDAPKPPPDEHLLQ